MGLKDKGNNSASPVEKAATDSKQTEGDLPSLRVDLGVLFLLRHRWAEGRTQGPFPILLLIGRICEFLKREPGAHQHAFNPSTQEVEAGRSLSWRSARSTKWVPRQLGLHRERKWSFVGVYGD